jgi:bifunctional non-homologous end joining protein LigD
MRFVVQEHHATHLHWDFRLEMDGVLKSWAIPKVPPTKLGIKRLAVPVEDHPLDYIDFKGVIPEGEYGAGVVKIWDSGTYELESRTPSKIVFRLLGKKMRGRYVLIQTKWGKGVNWLLFQTKE